MTRLRRRAAAAGARLADLAALAERRRSALEAAVALACAALFLSSGVFFDLVVSRDLHAAFLPRYEAAWRALRELRLPLWNPFESCGAPLLGAGQGAMLYPPTVLLAALPSPRLALLAFLGAHAALLAFALQRYLRRCGVSALAAACAPPIALAAAFRGWPGSVVDHPHFLAAAAWFPVMLLCLDAAGAPRAAAADADTGGSDAGTDGPGPARDRRTRLVRWSALLACAVAAQWLCGYPDFVLVAAVLLAVQAIVSPPGCRAARIGALALGLTLGTALASVQVLAIAEAVAESARPAAGEVHAGMRHALLAVRDLASLARSPADPRLAAALALAALAFLAPSRRRLGWGLGLLWSVFPLNPPFAWLYLVPPFSLSRFPLGWRYLGPVLLACLVAGGIDAAWRRAPRWARAALAGAIALALAQAAAVLTTPPPGLVPGERFDAGVAARRAATLAALRARLEPPPRLLSGAETLAGSPLRHGLPSAIGYEPAGATPRWIAELLQPFAARPAEWEAWPRLARERDVAALAGIGLVVATPRGAERLGAAGFAEEGALEGGGVVLRRPPLPRARIVHRVVATAGERESLETTRRLAALAGAQAVVGADTAGIALAAAPAGAAERVSIALDRPEAVTLDVELAAPGLVVLADTWARGWEARVDGAPAPVLRVDHAFRGVAAGAGRHRIELLYRPPAATAGPWITLAAALAIALLLVAGRRRGSGATPPEVAPPRPASATRRGFPSPLDSGKERRMLRTAWPRTLLAAAPRALLTVALVAGLGAAPAGAQTLDSDQQGAPQDAPVVPGIYDEEMCVMSIDQESKLVTFMSPNRENPNAAVAFAFKTIEGFKKGDLVKLKPAAEAKAGQPTVKVLEAGSSKCQS